MRAYYISIYICISVYETYFCLAFKANVKRSWVNGIITIVIKSYIIYTHVVYVHNVYALHTYIRVLILYIVQYIHGTTIFR